MSRKTGTILSNFDLMDLAQRMDIPLVGVYSKDKLPKQKIKGLFIVNIGDFHTGGSHWCCFSTVPRSVYYYDSYGAVPPIEVDYYIKATTGLKRYTINKIQTQSLGATYCGWFCIACLYCMMHTKGSVGISVSKRLDAFNDWLNSDDLDDNYYKLLNFFKQVKK
jgi:hypothetical protein